MDVKFNVKKFQNIMMKGTLNYSIDYLQLKFAEGRIKSGMVSGQRSVVTVIDVENNGIIDVTPEDDIIFNFAQPSIQLVPYLEIIDDEEATMKIIEDEKIVLKSSTLNSVVHFCTESTLRKNVLNKQSKDDFPYFHEIKVTEELLLGDFEKIKKIGTRFGKIYISVENGNLSIETTDKNNAFSNGTKVKLASGIEIDDLSICYDFKNFVALTTVIEAAQEIDEKEFVLKFAYIEEREGGMIHAVASDDSEQYFLLNRES
jgi:hypothetical protein